MGFSSDAGKPENKEPLLRPKCGLLDILKCRTGNGVQWQEWMQWLRIFFIRKKCWDGIGLAAVYGRLGSSSWMRICSQAKEFRFSVNWMLAQFGMAVTIPRNWIACVLLLGSARVNNASVRYIQWCLRGNSMCWLQCAGIIDGMFNNELNIWYARY